MIGTALSGTAEPITLQAAQAASNAVHSRKKHPVDLIPTCLEEEVSGSAVEAVAVALTGNPVTGFAPGKMHTHTHIGIYVFLCIT